MDATATRMTAEQYFAVSVEGDRTQLIDGALVVNEPRLLHQVVQTRLVSALHSWTQEAPGRGLASSPVDVVMSEHDVYGPDVVWIAEEHVPADWSELLPRVPDLAVEIRSPGTWRYDVGRKKSMYESGGLPELWLVDTEAEVVLVFRRSAPAVPGFDVALELGAGDALSSPQLPGFALGVGELFERPGGQPKG